ncbi:MFS transporter [Acetobacteraceae bacterium KSS8]|uniref:MFS transporter n=1 Tax=Endosaccharibacter trunci TaxID=2812733 RepID=A0ABT1W2Q5_9PROT|nr:MFS transporter [Acetobacteraceae bacterium KSS8]
MTGSDIRTLALASLGGALEFYDFVVFVFFAATLGHLFFPPGLPDWLRQAQTFGLFAAGYLARPLGGIIMAHYGDKSGRKRVFTLSVLLMAIPTLLIGLLPTYATIRALAPLLLLAMRIMQGAAIGGEAPGGWVFVAEHAPPGRSGLAIGLLTAGLTGGILLGSLVATLLNLVLSQERIAAGFWRLPFLLGGAFGFGAMVLRRWLSETPVFLRLRAEREAASLPSAIVLRRHLPAVLASMASTWMLTAAIVVVILLAPTLLEKQFAIAPARAQAANLLATITLTIGAVLVGLATDRFGFRRTASASIALLAVSAVLLFVGAGHDPALVVPLYALAGLGAGVVTITPVLMVRAFPPEVAFTGLSLSYNVAYAAFGGLTPLLVAFLAHENRLASGFYVAIVAAVGLVAALTAPVAKPRPAPDGMAEPGA